MIKPFQIQRIPIISLAVIGDSQTGKTSMIEQYIKKRENLQSQEEIDATEDFELSDEDFKDFADTIEEQRKQDNLLDDEEEDEE